jgi:hypothetical protein
VWKTLGMAGLESWLVHRIVERIPWRLEHKVHMSIGRRIQYIILT